MQAEEGCRRRRGAWVAWASGVQEVQEVHGGVQGVQARRVELLLLARKLGLELGLHELQLRDLPQLQVLLG